MKPLPTNAFLSLAIGEARSPAEFEKQVEAHLERIESSWSTFALSRHDVLHSEPSLTLSVDNRTDDNFENVVVELSLPLPVENVDTSPEVVADAVTTVQPLTEWEERKLPKLDRGIFSKDPITEASAASDGTAIIRFPPMHVYPQSSHSLETLVVALGPEWAASAITIEWRATASNTRGALAGSLSVSIP